MDVKGYSVDGTDYDKVCYGLHLWYMYRYAYRPMISNRFTAASYRLSMECPVAESVGMNSMFRSRARAFVRTHTGTCSELKACMKRNASPVT